MAAYNGDLKRVALFASIIVSVLVLGKLVFSAATRIQRIESEVTQERELRENDYGRINFRLDRIDDKLDNLTEKCLTGR